MKHRHQSVKRRKLGCITRAGLILIPSLLLVLVIQCAWDDLQTPQGRQKLAAETMAYLRTEDIYFVGIIVVVNIWLYAALTRRLYPTSGSIWRGIRDVGSWTIGANIGEGDDNRAPLTTALKHFFLIFILPFLFFKLGVFEYRLMKTLLHGSTDRTQIEQLQGVEQTPEPSSRRAADDLPVNGQE